MDELSEEGQGDGAACAPHPEVPRPELLVAEFTGQAGSVPLADTIGSLRRASRAKFDHLPEQAFQQRVASTTLRAAAKIAGK